jgi:hypothetical protein
MRRPSLDRRHLALVIILGTLVALPFLARAQRNNGAAAGPAKTAQESAPIDITGYWVSVVTEDWRFRMVTPKRGDYSDVPVTAEGKKLADAWDPVKDTADGLACKAYGAPGVMRLPTRLHITWQDPTTLKIEADNGTQTRLIHVLGNQDLTYYTEGMPAKGLSPGPPSWQGDSMAAWESSNGPHPKSGSLKVVTRNMRPGYLQKNGVPYGPHALLTEYFDVMREPNGDVWLLDVSRIEDPEYLRTPFIHSTHYKREPDGSKWDPSPCAAM